jgi:hypothetical protein
MQLCLVYKDEFFSGKDAFPIEGRKQNKDKG